MEGKKNTRKLDKVNFTSVLEMKLYHQTSLKIVPGKAGCNFAEISSSLKWERSTEEIKRNWLCAQFDAGELRESAPSRGISNSYFILSLNCPLCVQSLRLSLLPVTELNAPCTLPTLHDDALSINFSLVSKREALMLYKIKKKLGILRNVEITANIKLSQSREFIYQQHE